jgi:type VI secretion system secreted protein VgrG
MAGIGFTQANRALRIDTPLGPDALLLRSVSGQEGISQLFRYELELLSENDSISFDSIVGKGVSLHIQTVDSERSMSGYISRFSQGGQDERFTRYHAEMVPWLWFLTRTSDCRIFQKMTAPDIIKKIFDELKFQDYSLRLYGSFRPRDYCVQYRETDFNFVSRLLEEEGICYFFEHDQEGKKHTLILANDPAAYQPCPDQPKARCDFSPGNWHPDDVIYEWRLEEEYRPSAWAHTDYNFETPSTNLMATVKDDGGYEVYDYPGFYQKKGDGDQLAKTRLQETVAFKNRATGKSNCRCFTTGATVELTDHYRKDMNQKWLLTAVQHQCTMGAAYGSGGTDDGFFYSNSFEAVPASVPFRPARITPKPSVQGCQTAVVVGPAGEEIYTEKYGRVKVQFFWDRLGKKNENSSCWIRVSHPWAGKGWGSVSIPRIGQEVIVDFLEGDPDQPIIVGRVYHAENMPPYPLPEGAVVSGVKTNSTKGGGGYNEMSMNDTKSKELITVHAQKDMATTVEHDDTQTVHNNRTITVDGTHNETITKDTNITIQKGPFKLEVQDNTHTHLVKGDVTENYQSNQTTTVSKTIKIQSENADIKVVANTQITLECGQSTMTLKKDGTIIINGQNIQILGAQTVKAGVGNQNVVCDVQKVATSGAAINSNAVGMHTITGAVVKIN